MHPIHNETPLIAAIDDELMNLELIKFIISKTDYKFLGIQKSEDAISVLEKNIPSLILLDIRMPKLNGFDLCALIKENDALKDIPVIFLTGMGQVENKVKGFKLGGVDYITKPFNEHELTARVKTHVSLVLAKDKIITQSINLQRDNKLKNRLFSIIGHDLRSPLSAIKMQIDFILRGIIDPKDTSFMDTTVHNLSATTDEAFNLLDNLLGWARFESGVLSIIKEEIDIATLIEQSVRLQKMAIEHKNITLTTSLPKDNFLCFADLNMVKTVLRNLLSNAIKFTPKNGEINIRLQNKSNEVVIFIKDNGVGISKENLLKIRNPKEHFSKEGTEKEAGTGLGLVLCQDFIGKINSQLNIDSEIGHGSTFSFSLPLCAS